MDKGDWVASLVTGLAWFVGIPLLRFCLLEAAVFCAMHHMSYGGGC